MITRWSAIVLALSCLHCGQESSAARARDQLRGSEETDRDRDRVSDTSDCAPDDPARWRRVSGLFRDADSDGYRAGARRDVDGDPAVFIGLTVFADDDGDGVGAGAATQACTDGAVPAGFSATTGDCAPGDDGAWRMLAYSHVDGDGATIALAGQVCTGESLPNPFRTAASSNDCDPAVSDDPERDALAMQILD